MITTEPNAVPELYAAPTRIGLVLKADQSDEAMAALDEIIRATGELHESLGDLPQAQATASLVTALTELKRGFELGIARPVAEAPVADEVGDGI